MSDRLQATYSSGSRVSIAFTHIGSLLNMTPATGEFQHSSLVGGGPVMSAGLISVDQGLIKTLSPLSGHYRSVLPSWILNIR